MLRIDVLLENIQYEQSFYVLFPRRCKRFERMESGRMSVRTEVYIRRNCRADAIASLMDQRHNVSSMAETFSLEKLWTYIEETRQYVLPLLCKVKHSYPDEPDMMYILKYHGGRCRRNPATLWNCLSRPKLPPSSFKAS